MSLGAGRRGGEDNAASDDPRAQASTEIVEHDDNKDNRQEGCANRAVIREDDPLEQPGANAASTHKTDNDGRAHIDIPSVDGKGRIGGDDPRDYPIANDF